VLQYLPKLRLFVLLLAGLIFITSLDSCRHRRKRKKKPGLTWRQKLERAEKFLETDGSTGGQPTGPTPIIQPALTKQNMPQVVQAARSFIGTPYLTGGTSRTGMDCSGLVLNSYQAVGYTMPRISYQQADAGLPIAEKDLTKGDLVFFTDRKGNTQITHVGIITDVQLPAKVQFIHASTSLGVVENNLKQKYWQNVFLKGVRIRQQ